MYAGGNRLVEFLGMAWRRPEDLHGDEDWRSRVYDFLAGEASPAPSQVVLPVHVREDDAHARLLDEYLEDGKQVLQVGLARAVILQRPLERGRDRCVPSSFDDYLQNICWICREDAEEWDMWLSCHHIFCSRCSSQMLVRRMPCPLCRVASGTVLRGTQALPRQFRQDLADRGHTARQDAVSPVPPLPKAKAGEIELRSDPSPMADRLQLHRTRTAPAAAVPSPSSSVSSPPSPAKSPAKAKAVAKSPTTLQPPPAAMPIIVPRSARTPPSSPASPSTPAPMAPALVRAEPRAPPTTAETSTLVASPLSESPPATLSPPATPIPIELPAETSTSPTARSPCSPPEVAVLPLVAKAADASCGGEAEAAAARALGAICPPGLRRLRGFSTSTAGSALPKSAKSAKSASACRVQAVDVVQPQVEAFQIAPLPFVAVALSRTPLRIDGEVGILCSSAGMLYQQLPKRGEASPAMKVQPENLPPVKPCGLPLGGFQRLPGFATSTGGMLKLKTPSPPPPERPPARVRRALPGSWRLKGGFRVSCGGAPLAR
ncbi:unnamed protein product [Effrenium voratum]|nr:unnamed protein product [Effrenium voratum]